MRGSGIAAAGLALALAGAAHAAGRPTLVLEDVTLVDGVHDTVRPHVTVVVSGADISAVLDAPPAVPPDSAVVLGLSGHWLMPGLLDSHVHISHAPRSESERALARALKSGVTAVRDMGGDARRLAGLARDAKLGDIGSPDIFYSSVFAGPTFFTDPRVVDVSRGAVAGEAPWARAVTPSTDLDAAVLEAKGAGATAVKIYTDLPPAQLARVSAAAHRRGLRVWSHATVFPSRPSDALAAGVDVISHASMLWWQTTRDVPPRYGPHRDGPAPVADSARAGVLRRLYAEMKRRGTILDATLFVGQEMVGAPMDSTHHRFWQGAQAFAIEATRAAHAAGVAVSAGTDDMIGDDSEVANLHEELRLLVGAGFTPMEALQAATRVSAAACGALDRMGTVEPGKRANLLVLSADPTADVANTTHIRFVIKAGKLIAAP